MATTESKIIGDERKRHNRTLTLSSVVSILTICGLILPAVGVVLTPWFLQTIRDSVAVQMRSQVAKEVSQQIAPTNAGLKVIIESQITGLEDEIADMNWRYDNSRPTWTIQDARNIVNKQRTLRSQVAALAAMQTAENQKNEAK